MFHKPLIRSTLILVILLAACQSVDDNPETEQVLPLLAEWLTGEFDSSAQAQRDERFFNIRLAAAIIWPEREDGIWIYLEQASAEDLENPYRQRVYHLREPQPGQYISDVYTLPDPGSVIGGWLKPDSLEEFGPEDLQLRTGCSVYLQRDSAAQFSGGTRGKGCISTLAGASYASSEVVVAADAINSWDRGFNADDQQVWGAQSGAYEFRRK